MLLLWVLGFVSIGVANCELASMELFQDTFREDKICSLFSGQSLSKKCAEQIEQACKNRDILGSMLDATSHVPYTGMKVASRNDYGAFDECVAIDYSYEGGRILGKHCLYGLAIVDIMGPDPRKNPYLLSTCIPDACTGNDYNKLFNSIFKEKSPFIFNSQRCTTKEPPPYEIGDIITLFIIGVCVTLMVGETIYDIYLMKYQLKAPHPLCQAFSILYNGRKIITTTETPSKDQIMIFQGLRVLLMLWIIAGHAYNGQNNFSVMNAEAAATVVDKFYIVYIQAAIISVETFFYISGFLFAFQYLKDKRPTARQRMMGVPLMIVQRYLRLMPAALMVFLAIVYVFQHVGSGPLYMAAYEQLKKPCLKHWGAYFMYTQNYNNYDDLCIVPTWYISADMQLFILACFIMIPVADFLGRGKFKQVMAGLIALALFCTVLPIITKLSFRDYKNEYETHSRVVSFVIGIVMGTYMREKGHLPFLHGKFTEKTADLINKLMWTASTIAMLGTLLLIECKILYWGNDFGIVFFSLNKAVWSMCTSWMLYSCYYGQGGFANWFLSRPIFQILAKLTYSMYLTHGLVVIHYIASMRARVYFDDYFQFIRYCGLVTMTIVVSIIWTLAFESPMITVSKVIFGKIGKPSRRPEPKQHTSTGVA